MSANRHGKIAEDLLAAMMQSNGLEFDRQVRVGRQTIYRTELRVDFLIRNLVAFPVGLIVESKWQDIGGTIDEKFPYLVENIRYCYPAPTLVVVHGGKCRPGALEWLAAHVDGEKLIAVYKLEEFISWINRSAKRNGSH